MRQISDKTTEQQNLASKDIDQMSTREVLVTMNREDQKVPLAVEKAIPEIEQFVDKVVAAMKKGGRLFYVGAGTSGRLGVLDASEIPPTFSAPNTLVQGIMCGGLSALVTAVEGAEDDFDAGFAVVGERGLTENDCLLGISTSGMAAYVHAALKRAKEIGATTGLLVCNEFEKTPDIDIMIKAVVGPEIVTGSTRLKAGTATKLILNMITTTAMVKLNKTYGNLMVDLMTTNKKLWDRGARIIRHCTDVDYDTGMATLKKANGSVKTALVMVLLNIDADTARKRLAKYDGALRKVLDEEGKSLNL
ncbi:MAG: N-acetylmuramic acid 6-phosphate etherase [Candidatus Neomarinimicrobiota bacterium]|jgi:N-acetylmuramic acid 6-phosphate etherase|nr:N-acetylmuramic acid 6-phosphate etherase [Candidatus Neomarinimicrobiota bacterium]MDX9780711.1 N-acetylmuramic acid 6-phosphate etherase [bacterium]